MTQTKRYFRHFKGGLYQLEGEGFDSETTEPVVVYRALYAERKLWVRPKRMFFETVKREGKEFPRFKEISAQEAYAGVDAPIPSMTYASLWMLFAALVPNDGPDSKKK